MPDFPLLKTAAICQYPVSRSLEFLNEELRFLDGSRQSYAQRASSRRRWVLRLDLLSDYELRAIEDFFVLVNGAAGTFSFVDPMTGEAVSNCSFDADELVANRNEIAKGSTAIVIRQNVD